MKKETECVIIKKYDFLNENPAEEYEYGDTGIVQAVETPVFS